MAHFILSTAFTSGDVLPFLRLGGCLRRRGHVVTLITHEPYRALAAAYGVEFMPSDEPGAFARLVDDSHLFNSPRGIAHLYARHVLPTVSAEYAAICRAHLPGDTLLVARCAPAIAATMAAIDLGMPFLPVFLAPSNVTTHALLDELVGVVLEAALREVRVSMGRDPDQCLERWGRAAVHGLALWPAWFAPVPPGVPVVLHTTGFVLGGGPDDPPADTPAIATERSETTAAILITAGSGAFFDASFFDVCIDACARIHRSCVVVTQHRRLLPARLPAGVTWVSQVPFDTVLPAMAAIIHHGGIGTAAEALAAGIPQLVMGSGGDRPDNATHLARLGVAAYVAPGRWSVDDVATTLTRLLQSPTVHASCADAARRLAAKTGTADAADLCEAFLAAELRARAERRPDTIGVASQPHRQGSVAADLRSEHTRARLRDFSPDRRALLERRLRTRLTPNPLVCRSASHANVPVGVSVDRKEITMAYVKSAASGNPVTTAWTGPASVHPTGAESLEAWAGEHGRWIDRALLDHGAILFKGFHIDSPERFGGAAVALTDRLLDYVYRSTPRTTLASNVYSATEHPADTTIPMHNENAYQRDWPMKLAFCCVQPAVTGGQTPLALSASVTRRIDPDVLRTFAERGVMYVRNYGHGIDLPWETTFQTQSRIEVEAFCRLSGIEWEWLPEGRLRTRQTCHGVASHPITGTRLWFNQAHLFHVSSLGDEDRLAMLELFAEADLPRHAYFGDGGRIDQAMLDDVRQAYSAEAFTFVWAKGDLLLMDNMLVAHGRTPFTGPRRVLVAMGNAFSSCGSRPSAPEPLYT